MPSAQEIDIKFKRLQKLFRAVGDLDTQNLTRDDPYIDQLQAAYDAALRFAFGDASDPPHPRIAPHRAQTMHHTAWSFFSAATA
jgi:hypothetical protein